MTLAHARAAASIRGAAERVLDLALDLQPFTMSLLALNVDHGMRRTDPYFCSSGETKSCHFSGQDGAANATRSMA